MTVEAASPEETAGCEIVTVVTNASEPVLQGRWLNPGSHLNLVGAHDPAHREADSDAVCRSSIFVDTLAGALAESGDILIPLRENRLPESAIRGEIGQVLAGDVPGRCDEREITLFKSLGHVAQDLYAAESVYRRVIEGRR